MESNSGSQNFPEFSIEGNPVALMSKYIDICPSVTPSTVSVWVTDDSCLITASSPTGLSVSTLDPVQSILKTAVRAVQANVSQTMSKPVRLFHCIRVEAKLHSTQCPGFLRSPSSPPPSHKGLLDVSSCWGALAGAIPPSPLAFPYMQQGRLPDFLPVLAQLWPSLHSWFGPPDKDWETVTIPSLSIPEPPDPSLLCLPLSASNTPPAYHAYYGAAPSCLLPAPVASMFCSRTNVSPSPGLIKSAPQLELYKHVLNEWADRWMKICFNNTSTSDIERRL